MIVAFEGIDASGKETQVRTLKKWVKEQEDELAVYDVHEQDFPDYTNETGRAIQRLLKKDWSVLSKDFSEKRRAKALIIQSLMVGNRMEHGMMLEAYANDPHSLLLLDRYKASGFVYGASDGLNMRLLERMNYLLPEPRLWLLIDISADESFRRRPKREDYMEADRARMEETRKLYLELFESRSKRGEEHWKIVDGMSTVNDVHLRIRSCVAEWICKD